MRLLYFLSCYTACLSITYRLKPSFMIEPKIWSYALSIIHRSLFSFSSFISFCSLIYTHFLSYCAMFPQIQHCFLFNLGAFVEISILNLTVRPNKRQRLREQMHPKLGFMFFFFFADLPPLFPCASSVSQISGLSSCVLWVSVVTSRLPQLSVSVWLRTDLPLFTTVVGYIYVTHPVSVSETIKQAQEVNLFHKSWF